MKSSSYLLWTTYSPKIDRYFWYEKKNVIVIIIVLYTLCR